jgi:hypothetical protein
METAPPAPIEVEILLLFPLKKQKIVTDSGIKLLRLTQISIFLIPKFKTLHLKGLLRSRRSKKAISYLYIGSEN